MTFATALAAFREQRGLSQSRLADLAGYDPTTVQRLEAGTRNPTRESIQIIADALNLNCKSVDAMMILAGFIPPRAYYRKPAEQVIQQALSSFYAVL